MNKSPLNYLLTTALGAILWVVFAILMGNYLSENPNLAEKDPAELASELRIAFGVATFISICCCCYWYYYGSQEKTAGELPAARRKWMMLFIFEIILSVAITVIIVLTNLSEGIESKWFGTYFVILSVLTYIFFWLTTFLMSPRTVKYIPLGKK